MESFPYSQVWGWFRGIWENWVVRVRFCPDEKFSVYRSSLIICVHSWFCLSVRRIAPLFKKFNSKFPCTLYFEFVSKILCAAIRLISIYAMRKITSTQQSLSGSFKNCTHTRKLELWQILKNFWFCLTPFNLIGIQFTECSTSFSLSFNNLHEKCITSQHWNKSKSQHQSLILQNKWALLLSSLIATPNVKS